MLLQTAMAFNTAETIFRSVVSGITKTDTSAALQEGEPVVLSTATVVGSVIGQEVIRAATVTSIVMNRLLVGAIRGTIAHESVGLCQVYGVGPVRLAEASTVAAGARLVPDLNSTATALASSGRGAWIARTLTDTDLHYQAGVAVIVVAPGTAVSGTAGATNGSAFIRAL